MSETFFKNIQLLKGIPVDEFMDVMGMFSASLGYDCTSCHSEELYKDRAAFAIATPLIQRARQMIVMMNTINRDVLRRAAAGDLFHLPPRQNQPAQHSEPRAAVRRADRRSRSPCADFRRRHDHGRPGVRQVPRRRSAGRSGWPASPAWSAKGTYEGFNTGGEKVPIEIFAGRRTNATQIVHMPDGVGVKTFDGPMGGLAEPEADAVDDADRRQPVGRPAGRDRGVSSGASEGLQQWRVSSAADRRSRGTACSRASNPGEAAGQPLFRRVGSAGRTGPLEQDAVGHVPTQIDYSDYRDVAGVKMAFKMIMSWTDGQNIFTFNDVRTNVPIDAARFARPAPFKRN